MNQSFLSDFVYLSQWLFTFEHNFAPVQVTPVSKCHNCKNILIMCKISNSTSKFRILCTTGETIYTYLHFSSGSGSSWPGPPWRHWWTPTLADLKHCGHWELHRLVVRGVKRTEISLHPAWGFWRYFEIHCFPGSNVRLCWVWRLVFLNCSILKLKSKFLSQVVTLLLVEKCVMLLLLLWSDSRRHNSHMWCWLSFFLLKNKCASIKAESKQLTFSCEHFDIDGALDANLITNL